MTVKVALNGFGRIGRLAFRQMFDDPNYEVVAINDLTNPAMLDSPAEVRFDSGNLQIRRQSRIPQKIPSSLTVKKSKSTKKLTLPNSLGAISMLM